jgi:Asp-tRNA(Asn)/Glu-tRNA(Gln) amidotransferase A subunit family amidase
MMTYLFSKACLSRHYLLFLFAFFFFVFPSFAQNTIEKEHLQNAEQLLDLQFTESERDSALSDVALYLRIYQAMHKQSLKNWESPALLFDPLPAGKKINTIQKPVNWLIPNDVKLPQNKNDLAFYSIPQLASLIKNKKITSLELTQFFLQRLKTWGDTLQCVVSLTEEIAFKQAKQADEEIRQGKYRGILHGIPYGIKDLLAVPNTKTTWGAGSHKEQVIDQTATVVSKLAESGAVMVAKLTLGELAMGDVWFGGKTKNPWDLKQGSSGSSAGSASATAAGLVPFSIGTETWGSIVSPSTRCGTTGLRPTFGRVSRYGAMALSWSLDKIGPITRSAEDAAIVFDVIRGADSKDKTVKDFPFNYTGKVDFKKLKIGYLKNNFDSLKEASIELQTIETLKKLGADIQPVNFQTSVPVNIINVILMSEAAAAFDELTRTNQDELLVQQSKNSWANFFRAARFIPAVEYVNANRLRMKMIEEIDAIISQYDVLISPNFQNNFSAITNLTGHPVVVVPNGFKDGKPTSISFLGNLYDEATILAVAKIFQDTTDVDEKHPDRFK